MQATRAADRLRECRVRGLTGYSRRRARGHAVGSSRTRRRRRRGARALKGGDRPLRSVPRHYSRPAQGRYVVDVSESTSSRCTTRAASSSISFDAQSARSVTRAPISRSIREHRGHFAAPRARSRAAKDSEPQSRRFRHRADAVPVLPRNAAARSRDRAPRSAVRNGARVRDRRVRRVSPNVRRRLRIPANG